MPLTKKGKTIRKAMRGTYGSKKVGDRVFYASANAKLIKGVEKKASTKKK